MFVTAGDMWPSLCTTLSQMGLRVEQFRAELDANPNEEVSRDVELIRERIEQATAAAGVSAAGWPIEPAKVSDAACCMAH